MTSASKRGDSEEGKKLLGKKWEKFSENFAGAATNDLVTFAVSSFTQQSFTSTEIPVLRWVISTGLRAKR